MGTASEPGCYPRVHLLPVNVTKRRYTKVVKMRRARAAAVYVGILVRVSCGIWAVCADVATAEVSNWMGSYISALPSNSASADETHFSNWSDVFVFHRATIRDEGKNHIGRVRRLGHSGLYRQALHVSELESHADTRAFLQNITYHRRPGAIVFYADWCPHCKVYSNIFSLFASALHGEMLFGAINCAENVELRGECLYMKIFSIPTVKLLIPEVLYAQGTGLQSEEVLNVGDERVFVGEVDLSITTIADFIVRVNSRSVNLIREADTEASRTGGDALLTGLEALGGQPCSTSRWLLTGASPSCYRLHDGLSGLNYLMNNWVGGSKAFLSVEEGYALVDIMELIRTVTPFPRIKRAFAEALLFISREDANTGVPLLGIRRSAMVQKEDENTPDSLVNMSGIAVSDWQSFMESFDLGMGFEKLSISTEPRLLHCKGLTCTVWMLLHYIAEAAASHAEGILNNKKCRNKAFFVRQRMMSLPSLLDRMDGKEMHEEDLLRLSSMSTAALIDWNADVGCGVYLPFDIAEIYAATIDKFFGCKTCHDHFLLSYSKRLYGLNMVTSMENSSTLPGTSNTSMCAHNDNCVITKYRGNRFGRNFRDVYGADEMLKYDSLRLWLWRLHNAVTTRVALGSTLDYYRGFRTGSDYINCDVRWPPIDVCIMCRLANINTDSATSNHTENHNSHSDSNNTEDSTNNNTGFVITSDLLKDAQVRFISAVEGADLIEPFFADFKMRETLSFLKSSYYDSRWDDPSAEWQFRDDGSFLASHRL